MVGDRLPGPDPAFAQWQGLSLVPTAHAIDRMQDLGIDLHDVASILESGHDCHQGPRKGNIRERCDQWRGQTLRIVVGREYSGFVEGEAWVIINVKPVTS